MWGPRNARLARRALVWALVLLAGAWALGPGHAAGVLVPTTRADDIGPLRVSPNQLKPHECGGITLTNIVVGSGTVTGTSGNDLILGSAGFDILDGLGGDDCIVAGDGLIDFLTGGDGDDVLMGGPGFDFCWGGPGNDALYGCELGLQRVRPGQPLNLNGLPPGVRAQVQQRLGWPTPTPTPTAAPAP